MDKEPKIVTPEIVRRVMGDVNDDADVDDEKNEIGKDTISSLNN